MSEPPYIPTSTVTEPHFSNPSRTFDIATYVSHSDRYAVMSPYGLNLHFFKADDGERFLCAYLPSENHLP